MGTINESDEASESSVSLEEPNNADPCVKRRQNKNMVVIAIALFLISTGWFTLAATGETITRKELKYTMYKKEKLT